jgi:hypothetical protein
MRFDGRALDADVTVRLDCGAIFQTAPAWHSQKKGTESAQRPGAGCHLLQQVLIRFSQLLVDNRALNYLECSVCKPGDAGPGSIGSRDIGE